MAATLVTVAGEPALATYYSGGMPSKSFNYRTHGINSTWVGYYDTANIRWNQRVSSSIGRSTSAAANATAASYSQTWYGLYTPHGVRNINRTFTIQLNSRTIVAQWGGSSANLTRYSQIIATHEVGHSLSLDDNPNVSNTSIMKYNWGSTDVPTSYDITDVGNIY
jgi:hypothetical protein